jgi:hypothetical protein
VSTSNVGGQVKTTLLLVPIAFDEVVWAERVPVPDVIENAYVSVAGFGAAADA